MALIDATPLTAEPAVESNQYAQNTGAVPKGNSSNSRFKFAQTPDANAPLPVKLQELLLPSTLLAQKLEGLERTIERVHDQDSILAEQRERIEEISLSARASQEKLRPELDVIKTQLLQLGPKPEGTTTNGETDDVVKEREHLYHINRSIDGAIKKLSLVDVRAQQLLSRVQDYRQKIFSRAMTTQTSSPLSVKIWQNVGQALPDAGKRIRSIASNWVNSIRAKPFSVLSVLLLALLTYTALKSVTYRLIQNELQGNATVSPSFVEKAIAAGWITPLLAMPVIAAAFVLFFGMDYLGLLNLQLWPFAQKLLFATIVYIVASALTRAYLQPHNPAWRMINLANAPARRLSWITKTIALLYGIDIVLQEAIQLLYLPLPFNIAESFFVAIGFAFLLISIVRTPFTPMEHSSAGTTSLYSPYWLKLPLAAVALFIIAASLLGYIALGRFAAEQVVLTGTAVVLAMLMLMAVRAIVANADSPSSSVRQFFTNTLDFDDDQRRQANWVLAALLKVGVAAIAIPLILSTIGYSFSSIAAGAKTLFFGFEFAGMEISFARIFIAIALFIAFMFLTRLVQHWLANKVLTGDRVTERGLANSIKTGVGYLGFAIAAMIAISYAGVNVTNLAIVAGALSVGIGFGLQSIVNNFVSGLILLVERPIKVGDLIEVANQRGQVRRISVRSTEIETFDKASVIVPNSELISGSVINLTHQNTLGRILIPVGVAYDSDPVRVQQLLENIADQCEHILQYPKPMISFDALGASSLDFTLRAYVPNINSSLTAKTDLRTRIIKTFQEEGIEIPYPQQDVHLRDLDGVKKMLAQAALNRMQQSAGSPFEQTQAMSDSDHKEKKSNANEKPSSGRHNPSATANPTEKRQFEIDDDAFGGEGSE